MAKWKRIGDFPVFEVSSDGRVRNSNTGRVLKPRIPKTTYAAGYVYYALVQRPRRVERTAHRLVAEAFIPNPENKPTVNHKNGIKSDNRVENLEWATISENVKHSFANGRKAACGSRHGSAKLDEAKVSEIKKRLVAGERQIPLARKFGVLQTVISAINREKIWKHVPWPRGAHRRALGKGSNNKPVRIGCLEAYPGAKDSIRSGRMIRFRDDKAGTKVKKKLT